MLADSGSVSNAFLKDFITFYSLVCVCARMHTHAQSRDGQRTTCGSQFERHLPCRSQRSDSGHQVWWQVPLPAELSRWPRSV